MSEATMDIHERKKRATRKIVQRWYINGTLTLQTPAQLSNGDADPSADLTVLTDPRDGRALLTGTSLAGALRHYLNRYLDEYEGKKEKADAAAILLFGGRRGATGALERPSTGEQQQLGQSPQNYEPQSALIVEDALGTEAAPRIELRNGVRIDGVSRTADDEGLFDVQLLAAGTTFGIGFEFLIDEEMLSRLDDVSRTLAIVLRGLQEGEIALGGRKRRGYGEIRATQWRLWQYDLRQSTDFKQWLVHDVPERRSEPQQGDDILALLQVSENTLFAADARSRFELSADFAIAGSVLIRSGFEAGSGSPDMVHLHAYRNDEQRPILSGTSLGGVMRAQARRIARTLATGGERAETLVNELFGFVDEESDDNRRASRFQVAESEIRGGQALVQSRVAIDRFTGGAYESALFAEQPHFGGEFTLRCAIAQEAPPEENTLSAREKELWVANMQRDRAEIGLLLLVLKDLWTGFTPVGGESSVGRGRLRGRRATLARHQSGVVTTWELSASKNGLQVSGGSTAELEAFVEALKSELLGEKA